MIIYFEFKLLTNSQTCPLFECLQSFVFKSEIFSKKKRVRYSASYVNYEDSPLKKQTKKHTSASSPPPYCKCIEYFMQNKETVH